jgi:hypothetical protein
MRVACVLAAFLLVGCGCRRSSSRARLDAGGGAGMEGTGGVAAGSGGTGGSGAPGPVDAAVDALQPMAEVGADTPASDLPGVTPDAASPADGRGVDVPRDLPPGPDGPPPLTPVFHLTLPLSTSVVTTRTPTVGWTDPGGTDYFIIEICRDAACNDVIERNFSGLTTYTVMTELEGVVYWRVKAMLPRNQVQPTTGTALMFVGPQSAHDTSMLAYPDFNRDGVPDVALAAEGGDVQVRLFRPDSGSRGMQTLAGPARALAYGVDLNADGFGDLLVARADAVDVYYGSSTSLINVGSLTGEAGFGATLAGVGDVNGDGFGDAVIGSQTGGAGTAALYLSSRMGLGKPTGAPLPSARFGAAADVNADGYADVVTCSPATGKVSLYTGAASGLVAAATLDDPRGAVAGGSFGNACQGVGDLNGDGFGDVVVTGSSATQKLAFVYLGGEKGLGAPATVVLESAGGHVADDLQVASAGDVDHDGLGDVAFAGLGVVQVFLGSASGLAASPAAMLSGDYRLAVGVGDLNGDHFGDLLVAPRNCAGEPVKILAGKVGGLSATPLYYFAAMTGCPGPLLAR